MIKVRRAKKSDKSEVFGVLKAADLYYPAQSLRGFWVAEKAGQILGVVQLRRCKNYFFLSSLGVISKQRGKKVAFLLLKNALKKAGKKVYLYTIIPRFFQKFGFKKTKPTMRLPSKKPFGCDECFPQKCVTMVRRP